MTCGTILAETKVTRKVALAGCHQKKRHMITVLLYTGSGHADRQTDRQRETDRQTELKLKL